MDCFFGIGHEVVLDFWTGLGMGAKSWVEFAD
jgi:hypothetical protein